MDNFQLNPLPLRDEALPGYEPAAWKPNWKCFCCHDNGIIPERIVKIVMPNYVTGRHKPVKCNNCNIQLGEDLYKTNTLDTRFPAWVCERLDNQEREMWREWSHQQHLKRQSKLNSVDSDSLTKNLRTRSRTNCEQETARRKHRRMIEKY